MKKTLALLLALALCLALCACGGEKPAETPAPSAAPGGVIPKGGGEQPAETPAPTPTPEPTPEPVEIEITDLCAESGTVMEAGIYPLTFSYTLPTVSGPDTPYIAEINRTAQALYDDLVKGAWSSYEEYGSLSHYCAAYYTGARDGVNSILITADSDIDMDEFWCFNFDDAGNEVDNAAVLRAAGVTEAAFLSAARDYLEDITDLSAYFGDDDGWKQLQKDTLDEKNLNAGIPMAILPDGNLGFVATVFTPAGGGEYQQVLELEEDGSVSPAELGRIVRDQLVGTFLRMPDNDDPNAAEQVFYEFFPVGDALTMEAMYFDTDTGDAYSYWAVDIIPDDPAALLRADNGGTRVRVVSHCPDVFGGSYFGEPGYYTLYTFEGGVVFADFEGGTSLDGTDGDVYLIRAYRDDYGLENFTPGTDYDHFDYDAAEAAGLAGVWNGAYRDADYALHALTLEITNWGELKMRDCVEDGIPRILAGSYYIAQADDESGAPEGAVVFNLVRVGGYKMPVVGYCYMVVDEDGDLLIREDDTSWLDPLTQCGEDQLAVLHRAADVRRTVEPAVFALEENERVHVDINADGTPEELGCYFERDSYDAIDAAVFVVEGAEYTLSDMGIYDGDIYLMVPPTSGAVYFWIDGQSDNDYRVLTVVGVGQDNVWYVEDFLAGFAETPTDPEQAQLRVRTQILSTMNGVRTYRVGGSGLPEATEPYYHMNSDLTLTVQQDVDCWVVAPDSGELVDTATLSAGEKVKPLRTDGSSFMDLQLENGDVRRVWIDMSDWPQTIDGNSISDYFDGLRFAG